MSPTAEILLAVFTGLTTLALVVQAIALVVISRKMRELTARVDTMTTRLTKQIDFLATQADNLLSMLKSATEKIHVVQENVAAITAVQAQALDVIGMLTVPYFFLFELLGPIFPGDEAERSGQSGRSHRLAHRQHHGRPCHTVHVRDWRWLFA